MTYTCTRPHNGCRMILMNGAKQLMPFIGPKSPFLDALLKTPRASVPIASATMYTKSLLNNRHHNTHQVLAEQQLNKYIN